jgi:putative transposase
VYRDGKWFLYATCDVPEPDLTDPGGFLGVDLGVANIATTGDGTRHSGKYLNRQRHRSRYLRRKSRRRRRGMSTPPRHVRDPQARPFKAEKLT